jgi:hypothetical protein
MSTPHYAAGAAFSFPHALLLPPGGKVAAYLRSGGIRSGETLPAKEVVTTLNAAAARVRAGIGDTIVVMPDHAENIASADQVTGLVAGTNIVGLGSGNLRPTFTWSAAAATFLFDVANTRLSNCILNMAGSRTSTTALTVAAPITVSAAGCAITDCEINFGVDADQLTTVGITTTAAGKDFTFARNYCFGDTAAESTTFFRAVGADRLNFIDNRILGATSAVGIGLFQFITTASLNCCIERNFIANRKAASEACVSVSAGATASSGFVNDLYLASLANGANQLVLGHANGAWGLSAGAFSFGRHVYVSNLAGERMAEVTVVSA